MRQGQRGVEQPWPQEGAGRVGARLEQFQQFQPLRRRDHGLRRLLQVLAKRGEVVQRVAGRGLQPRQRALQDRLRLGAKGEGHGTASGCRGAGRPILVEFKPLQ